MKAIRMLTQIGEDRKLVLELPPEASQGEAEVIVLMPEVQRPNSSRSLADFLQRLSEGPRTVRSKEEIDQYLETERQSWE